MLIPGRPLSESEAFEDPCLDNTLDFADFMNPTPLDILRDIGSSMSVSLLEPGSLRVREVEFSGGPSGAVANATG